MLIRGTGINAINFTYQHKGDVKVVAYIDSHRKTDCLETSEEIKILRPEEAEGLLKQYFLVVAISEGVY